MLLCQTGMRAGMAVVAMRQLGFEKVFALAGGFKGLSDYLDPMTAYSPVPEPQL
jgi:rhodanese-related sulfurtransferase